MKTFLAAYKRENGAQSLAFTVMVHDEAAAINALRGVTGLYWTQRDFMHQVPPHGVFSFLPSAV